jgi:hypothetical protein
MHWFYDTRRQVIFISILYLAISAFQYRQYGVKVVNDSARYIEYATGLHQALYFDPHNFWYIGYALYIFGVQLVGGSAEIIVAGQYTLGLLAVIALFFTSLTVWNNNLAAVFTAVAFIFFIDIGQWHSYVLAESIYTSFLCFSLFLLSKLYGGRKSTVWHILTALVVLYTAFMKPTGIALPGALLFVVLHYAPGRLKSRLRRNSIRVAATLIFLLLVNRMLTTYLVMENYRLGEVIYAIRLLPSTPGYETMIITPPVVPYVPPPGMPPLLKIVSFILHHPLYWMQLFFTKVFFLLAHVRPYWSVTHNLYATLLLLPAYFLFVKGIRSEKLNPASVFALAYVAIQILGVGITSEDWDGRFLAPILPVVFLYSGKGFASYFRKRVRPMV